MSSAAPRSRARLPDHRAALRVLAWGVPLAGLLLLVAGAAGATTTVTQAITADSTWSLADSPFVVHGEITVLGSDGADRATTLTIEAGVEVRFAPGASLVVGSEGHGPRGALVALGTEDARIRFTADDGVRGSWGPLSFRGTSAQSVLENFTVDLGGRTRGAVESWYGNPAFRNCVVTDSRSSAFHFYSASALVEGCTIEDNANSGVFSEVGRFTLRDSEVRRNGQAGVYVYSGFDALVERNVIASHSLGVYQRGHGATYRSNVIEEISNIGILLVGQNSVLYDNLFRANSVDARDEGIGNQWNVARAPAPDGNILGGTHYGGNRWHSDNGLDCGSDGVGDYDVPHVVLPNGKDYRPLTLPDEIVRGIDATPPTTTSSFSGWRGNAGWFRSEVTAYFVATDDVCSVDDTLVSLNEDAPVRVSGSWRILKDGEHALEFWSVDGAGNAEARKGASLRIDRTVPVTTLETDGPAVDDGTAVYVTSATTLSLAAFDATSGVAATRYAIDGPVLGPYGGPFAFGGEDGARTVSFGSEDVAGNSEDRWGAPSRTVRLDNTPPTLTITTPRVGSVVAGENHVEADTDWDGFADDVERALGSDPADAASRPDPTGLGSAASVPGPVADAHASLARVFVVGGSVVHVEAESEDPLVNGVAAGVGRVELVVDGSVVAADSEAPYAFAWDTTGLAPGDHLLEVRAFDRLGNSRAEAIPVLVVGPPVDAAALVPEGTLPAVPADAAEPSPGWSALCSRCVAVADAVASLARVWRHY